MKLFVKSLVCLLLLLISCKRETKDMPVSAPSVAYHHSLQTQSAPISSIEEKLTQYGLVNLSKIDDRIIADLKYASTDNFLDENVYGELQDIFMQKEVAEKLIKAQDILQDYDSSLYLIVHDAVRPLSIQQKMWDLVKNTEYQRYVASPYGGGGMHNYGCAVDVSIIDSFGTLLDMGTPFDYFGDLAQPRYNYQFLATGELTQEHVDNRLLLRKIMREAGFLAIDSEWWHFNAFGKEYTRATYQIVE